MNIVCIGGGPAGLYFALLMKKQNPAHDITVVERNQPYDTFGWGVVFSDQTLGNLEAADAQTADGDPRRVQPLGRHRRPLPRPQDHAPAATASAASAASACSTSCRQRCEELGVKLVFETDVAGRRRSFPTPTSSSPATASTAASARSTPPPIEPDIDLRQCRFVWLGTHKRFEAFTFAFEETEHGWFQAHAYQFDGETSTFIVETPEEVWQAAGLDRMEKEESIAFCERLFAQVPRRPQADVQRVASARLGAVDPLSARDLPAPGCTDNGRAPVVLMGDAAHTAHFSIGSGTKLALEDAIELARCIGKSPGRPRGGAADYEAVRSVEVLRIQNAARNSTEWFENVERYAHLPPEQFAYSLLTRSQRISHENLRLRDRRYVEEYEDWLAARLRRAPPAQAQPVPPMFTPFTRARRHAEEPGGGVADGAVLLRRRHAGRLPPGASRRPRDGRRRPWWWPR